MGTFAYFTYFLSEAVAGKNKMLVKYRKFYILHIFFI